MKNDASNSASRNLFTRRYRVSAPLGALFAVTLLVGSTSLASADVVLKGTVGPRTIDGNVVIARGTSCVLNGTIIKGNVRILNGAKLRTFGAQIEGNIQAAGAKLVDLSQVTTIGGDVQGKGTRSILVRGNTRVEGNVQLTEGSAPRNVDALLVQNAIVGGDVQAEKSSGRLQALAVSIDGNLQFVENRKGPYSIKENTVKGDLQFFKNQGSGMIIGNRVGGNLQSKENRPRPIVRKNVVEGSLEVE